MRLPVLAQRLLELQPRYRLPLHPADHHPCHLDHHPRHHSFQQHAVCTKVHLKLRRLHIAILQAVPEPKTVLEFHKTPWTIGECGEDKIFRHCCISHAGSYIYAVCNA